ncbi:MAG: VWA domain-containing protein [Burkholderiaceae bacterium]|nr:VWA domain-containing protein [Betaproteobacteria bacterium]MBP6645075.1 VWA domain-containing protein [Burkholderiaceae bacterium]
MEEHVGRWWHNALDHLTQASNQAFAVHLPDVQSSIGMMFRAAGGDATLRIACASDQAVGGVRAWIARLAGSGERAELPALDSEVVALPSTVSVFANLDLNRDLFIWLAILAAHYRHTGNWVGDNLAATEAALSSFPGFRHRYLCLRDAHLAQRPDTTVNKTKSDSAENYVQAALQGKHVSASDRCQPADVMPVWLWMTVAQKFASSTSSCARPKPAAVGRPPSPKDDGRRRRTQAAPDSDARNAMVLPFRGESIMSWSEMVRMDRATDDEDDGSAVTAANDMDKLSVTQDGETLASRVKFDLDLPSASHDEEPLGPGQKFPEWDYKRGVLQPDHCVVQELVGRSDSQYIPLPALRRMAKSMSRRLEVLRDAPRMQHGQEQGDDIDLDAWVRLRAEEGDSRVWRSDTPAVYSRRINGDRSLATLLLADLSLSTDAYANDQMRVIDVIRDAMYAFGEALNAVGDPFAMWGFSSVRRHQVRLQYLKGFDEPWANASRNRVGAVRPGFYTRMGAAIRHATLQLGKRSERRRLLMLLTDGKPNDLDQYEGRYGLEDTKRAIHEARLVGLVPFCVTIDEAAHDYLPMLFGRQGYVWVHRPQDLALKLTQAWRSIAK